MTGSVHFWGEVGHVRLTIGGKAPNQVFLKGWLKEAPEVQAQDSGSLQDPKVSKEHLVAHLQVAIVTPGPQNCPGAGDLWPLV